jgi:hypothetical protein
MKALTNEELPAKVTELVKPVEPFRPTAYYDRDGDCIEFLASPDNFFAERVDDRVTVYYSERTREVIGSLIKGVAFLCKKLVERLPGFKIEIHHGKTKLVHIFRLKLWTSEMNPNDITAIIYQKLINVADESGVEVELPKAA